MKKTIFALWKYKVLILLFVVIGFLAGYFVTEYIINRNFGYYEIQLESSQHPSVYITEERFDSIIATIDYNNAHLEEGQKKVSYASIDYAKMIKKMDIKTLDTAKGLYELRIKLKFFPTSFKTSSGAINEGANRCATYMKLMLSYIDGYNIKYVNDPIVVTRNTFDAYHVGIVVGISMLIVSIMFVAVASKSKNPKILTDIHDNEFIFKTPFHKKYWVFASTSFTSIKGLCGLAILFAIMFSCKALKLPSGFGDLGVSPVFLVFSIISMIYGPLAGLVIGVFSDVLGYFVFPTGGAFFFGYTLNAMLSGFIYGIFFYRTKITFVKTLYARILVNLLINVVLGSIWMGMMYGWTKDATLSYMLAISLPKNLVYLLPQSIVLYLVLKAIVRPCFAAGLIDERIAENVTVI